MEVETRPQAVHFEEDLGEEQSQEEELGIAWTQKDLNETHIVTPWDAKGSCGYSQRKSDSHLGWLWCTMATQSVLSATRLNTVQ